VVIGDVDLEPDMKALSASMLAMGTLDDDRAAKDPRIEAGEAIDPTFDRRFESEAGRQVA
jgi:hypothetical protein